MPRRSILSAIERTSIYAVPDDMSDLITRFAFTEQDVTIIKSHRGAENRLGFAVQLAYIRFPGVMLGVDEEPAPVVVRFVSDLLSIGARAWDQYGARGQTRCEHLVELQDIYEFVPFLGFDPEVRAVIYTTNAIESINARIRKVVKSRGHFPTETAALKCVYLAVMSLDPTGRGRQRWMNRWKHALNAFTITFPGRIIPTNK